MKRTFGMIRYNARITRHPGTFVSEMQRHVTQGTAHTALHRALLA